MKLTITLILTTCLFITGCKKKTVVDKIHINAVKELRGEWEMHSLRGGGSNAPSKVTMKFTSYDKTKLTYLKFTAYYPATKKDDPVKKVEKTIRISFKKKGIISPSLQDEVKKNPKSFIWYNPEHQKEVSKLNWEYSISGSLLTIKMGKSSMVLLKTK